jgi:16S rRNA (cytosine1402-N4)-methyltransferase
METEHEHVPVLLSAAIQALRVRAAGRYVDATYGRGGHSRMILQQLSPEGRLMVMDQDPTAIAHAEAQLGQDPRTYIYRGSFAKVGEFVADRGWIGKVDGLLLDLGVSSPQLTDAERGFSFRQAGPLDMRMDPEQGQSAAQWLAEVDEQALTRVLKTYGEERFARRIARAILRARQQAPIDQTRQLAAIVAAAVPRHEPGKDPATRTFQAIRIFINHELEALQRCLDEVPRLLAPGGRLVVISFHSLEDRLVKRFIRQQAKGDPYPADLPIRDVELQHTLRAVGKPIYPDASEIAANPRARSAVMRVAERLH